MPRPLVLCENTLRNPAVLETRAVPRRVFGRVVVIPKRPLSQPVFWRILAEMGVVRYVVALLPFPLIAVLRPSLALPIAQAPLLMIFVIWLFDSRVLGLSDAARAKLLDEAERDRRRDAFRSNGRRALTRLSAARPDLSGEITLVVEQSELARLPTLTLVSVQRQLATTAEVLDLSAEERDGLLDDLFDENLSPEALHEVTLATRENLHQVTFDTRGVSAHARLAALAAAR